MVFNFCITLAVNSMIIIACYTSWSVYTVGNRRKSLLHNAQSVSLVSLESCEVECMASAGSV